jgi:hypothetical protein
MPTKSLLCPAVISFTASTRSGSMTSFCNGYRARNTALRAAGKQPACPEPEPGN